MNTEESLPIFRDEIKTPVITTKTDEKIEMEIAYLEYERKQNEIHELKQNTELRKKYAKGIFIFLVVWSCLIFLILFLNAGHYIQISDSVMITLLTSTTVNIIGLFLVVVKYFFPPNQ